MKNRDLLKKVALSIFGMTTMAFASEAFAGYVEIRNLTEHRACFGKTTSFFVEGEGSGSVSKGWDCVEPRGSFRFDINVNDYIYVSAIDDAGQDFLASRMTRYDSVETYAPVAAVKSFGVEKVARIDGTFSYAYFTGGNPWSNDVIVPDRAALDAALTTQGFRKLTGRILRGADVGTGLVILINF